VSVHAGGDPIHIITPADDHYAIPLAVTVRSLLDTLGAGRTVHVTVIDGGILESTKEKLVKSWSGSEAWPRCSIVWRAPDYGDSASIRVWGRVPKLTYARINLAAYLPEAPRTILLDSDVLVRIDIGQLWDTSLADAVAAAVVDPFIPTVSSRDGLAGYAEQGLPPTAPYLNAGVMLVDLALWRERELGPRALAFVDRHWRETRWYDQDALNAVLAGQWVPLDGRWQMHPRLAGVQSITAAGEAPWIVHFSGRLKPWTYRDNSDYDREFFEVLDRTDWCGWRPPVTVNSLLTGFYARRLRRWLYPVEVRMLGSLDRFRRLRELHKDE
jgi:lipopolysaccharide biosynthesis glycosyltransferase